MLKKKLLIGLILAGCFSGYASAAAGPTLSKTLPVNLAQETTLSVDWAPVTTLQTNVHGQGPVGVLSISSSGLSSITVKSTHAPDLNQQGRISFMGPSDSYIISHFDYLVNKNVTNHNVNGGFNFTPASGTSTLPDNFKFGLASIVFSSGGNMPAGVYTANITVDSVIA